MVASSPSQLQVGHFNTCWCGWRHHGRHRTPQCSESSACKELTLRPLLIPPLPAHEIKSCLSNKHAPSANIAAVSPCASQASQAAVHSAAAPAPAPRHHPGTPVRRSRVEGVCPRPGEPKPALSGGLHCAMTRQLRHDRATILGPFGHVFARSFTSPALDFRTHPARPLSNLGFLQWCWGEQSASHLWGKDGQSILCIHNDLTLEFNEIIK